MQNTLLFLHILSAIVAVGVNASYFFWLRRAVVVPETRTYTLTTIRLLETRIAIPAYVIALATGVALALTNGPSFGTAWVDTAVVIWLVIMALGGFHARVVKRQLAAADSGDSDAYESGHARGRVLMALIMLCAMGMLFLMVAKPALWSG